jgi:KaiC/GvpD/RAD55 family RecA-like ATPase
MTQDESGTLLKQKLLISYLVSSQELFTKCNPILRPDFFDVRLKNTINFVKNYFDEFKAPPTHEQILAETSQSIEVKETLTKAENKYAEVEIESFCKEKAIEHAIYASSALVNAGKINEVEKLIRDAITISLQRNIGLDYFDDPETRLKLLALMSNGIPTKFTKLDTALAGGLNRKEMIIFAAGPGVGKSLTMGNIAKNLMEQGLHGCYFTLELAEEVVAKRFDSMFSGVAQSEILKNITETSIKIKAAKTGMGKLFIKRFPESATNANHLRAYLKEFEIVNGFTPNFLVVDYLDLMCSVQQISAENTFTRDKFIAEELRAIANEYNCILITASQLNRGSQQVDSVEDIGQAHIAGGISKINTADNVVAIIQTPQMKARGEMMFKLLKTRSSNGVGSFFMLAFNSNTLVLTDIGELDNPTTKNLSSIIREKAAKKEEGPQFPKPIAKPGMGPGGMLGDLPWSTD